MADTPVYTSQDIIKQIGVVDRRDTFSSFDQLAASARSIAGQLGYRAPLD